MARMLAGAAAVVISPPIGTTMSGYAGRVSGCVGIHDDLHARALVLDDGATRVAVVSCDLVGFDADSVARIRREASARTGIPEGNIMVACTHTHSGPATMPIRACGAMDEAVTRGIEKQAADAIAQGSATMQPASIEVAYGESGIAINRRQRQNDGSIGIGENPGGTVDREVGALRVVGGDGKAIATLVNHGCHAVVMGGDNLQISADFPGAVSRGIEKATGGMGVFLQGCCGNLNPRERASFEAVDRMGRELADDALSALGSAKPIAGTLRAASEIVELPLRPIESRETAEAVLAEQEAKLPELRANPAQLAYVHLSEALRDWARSVIARHDRGDLPTCYQAEVQAIAIGELVLVALPGEIFTEIGMQIKQAIPGAFVLGYSNGNVGYVFTASAFAEGGYEVEISAQLYGDGKFAPEVEGVLVQAGIRVGKTVLPRGESRQAD